MEEKAKLVDVLKAELEFLDRGGYRKPSWRPQFIFEDSPTCLNYGWNHERRPCSECVLMQFVPPDKREEKIPCRFIPLNDAGVTVESFYRSGTQDELESALREWLISRIETAEHVKAATARIKAS